MLNTKKVLFNIRSLEVLILLLLIWVAIFGIQVFSLNSVGQIHVARLEL